MELQGLREKYSLQSEYIQALEDLNARERDLAARELESQQRLTGVAEMERDAEERRAEALQELLDSATDDGRGFGCTLKKIFTLGIGRC